MKLGIDFKTIAIKAGGHAAGAAAFTQINKLKFMQNFTPEKQAVKGAIVAGLGYVVAPMIGKKLGLSGKGTKGDFVTAVGEGLGMVGVMLIGNAVIKPTATRPALFPVISGVDGYEENPIEGLGMLEDDEPYQASVQGYEQNPVIEGLDDMDEAV